MNYYEHHIGDYAAATGHLSLVEDALYSRMLRRYYLQEEPLPGDPKQVARLIGARSEDEISATENLLGEFFVLAADGWHQKRCDENIARFREKQGKARASAEARWSGQKRSDSERIANAKRTQCDGNALQAPSSKLQEKSPPTEGAPAPDPIFGTGLEFLTAKAVPAKSARSFLGLLRKELRDDLVVSELLTEAERQDVSDPCAWLRAAARERKSRGPPTVAARPRDESPAASRPL